MNDLMVLHSRMEKIVSLCKRRGFIYPGSEIYGGIQGFYDYGPLGVELKNNIKKEWWRRMVYEREDVVGLDAAIIMNPKVWEASGHTKAFTDPLVECKLCHQRFRFDQPQETRKHESLHALHTRQEAIWTKPKRFNLLVEAKIGVVEGEKSNVYLRGEITQGVFVNFRNVVDSTRIQIPFGIAQIGKAFRNEITPGNFTFRTREFEQMELEFFIKPEEKEANKWFDYWKKARMDWYEDFGMARTNLRFREHKLDERAHYARAAEDIEYKSPFGWSEFEGVHHRGDWDLSRHKLKYEDYTPWVIETSGGVDRSALFFLIDAYIENNDRVILKLDSRLAPYKVAVFPLLANKPDLIKTARMVFDRLKPALSVVWDDRGNIGKRYFSQDEIGTPWCVTIDFQTLKDKTVTIRDRDTTKQIRLGIDKLQEYFENKLKE